MKRTYEKAFLVICLPLSLVLVSSCAGWAASESPLNVGPDGRFQSIQAAARAARAGETIEVASGTYPECVTVKKSLTIRGVDTGGGKPVVDCRGKGTVFTLAANHVTLEGFKIIHSARTSPFDNRWGDAAVLIASDENRIGNNLIVDNDWGVIVLRGARNVITANEITGNRREAILLMGASDNRISDNAIADNEGGGVYLSEEPKGDDKRQFTVGGEAVSSRNEITGNTIDQNTTDGVLISYGEKNVISGNTISKTRPTPEDVQRLVQKRLKERKLDEYKGPTGGFGVELSCLTRENVIRNNRIEWNNFGIFLNISFRNDIRENAISDGLTGLLSSSSSGNTIVNNDFKDNASFGIKLGDTGLAEQLSGSNDIFLNNIEGSEVSAFDATEWTRAAQKDLYSKAGKVTERYLKTLKERTRLVMLGGRDMAELGLHPNRWDDGYTGNHYDDFDERPEGFIDADKDGIGDRGRPIPGGSAVDRFPLAASPLTAVSN